MASSDNFDLIVIGGGPAGEKAGAQAAYFGKRVAVIERAEHMGGSCINTGTIPSKTLRESALYFSCLKQRGFYGIDYSLKENLPVHDLMHQEREVVGMERRRILKNLVLHKIELVRRQAVFEDPYTVAVAGPTGTRHLKGEIFLISTGSQPHRPSEITFDDIQTLDSDTFLQMDRIPKSLAVIGGGVIGCEYASIFKALGVDMTLVDGRDRLLPFLDNEISAAVDGLALEKAGLVINDLGYIAVDHHYPTVVPHIYATELIHIGMMVLDNGLTLDEFIEQVFNYPTLSELYKYAAYDGLGNLAGHKLREG